MIRATLRFALSSALVALVALAAQAGTPCPEGYAPDPQGKCTLCADGYLKNPKTGACTKPPTCAAGQVLVVDRCFPACPPGRAHDSSGKCSLCAPGYVKHPKTGTCQKTAG